MSFIAAVLILNLDTADAFIAFSNLLNKPCQMAFFRVDHGLVSMLCVMSQYHVFIEQELPNHSVFSPNHCFFKGGKCIMGCFKEEHMNLSVETYRPLPLV